jgi:hypothetical protein
MGYDLQLFKILVYQTYEMNINSQIANKILVIYSEEHKKNYFRNHKRKEHKKSTQPETY